MIANFHFLNTKSFSLFLNCSLHSSGERVEGGGVGVSWFCLVKKKHFQYNFLILDQYSSLYLPAQIFFVFSGFGCFFSSFLVIDFSFLQVKAPSLDTFPISHWTELQQLKETNLLTKPHWLQNVQNQVPTALSLVERKPEPWGDIFSPNFHGCLARNLASTPPASKQF